MLFNVMIIQKFTVMQYKGVDVVMGYIRGPKKGEIGENA